MAGYRYLVRGLVQGVGYRYFVLHQARKLGLAGFARNRRDGSVEVVAEGPEAELRELEQRLREGPPAAAVSEVEREPAPPVGASDFEIC